MAIAEAVADGSVARHEQDGGLLLVHHFLGAVRLL
jgi:hypothetical protein